MRREEEHAQCRLQRHRVLLFFLTVIETHLGNNPKMGYDNYPLLYNSYGAKTLRSKLVKKTKGKKMV
jgi:hypothetical protein